MAENRHRLTCQTEKIDFTSYKVCDLRRFLRNHGFPVSGSKTELLARAKGTLELETKPLSEVKTLDDNFAKQCQQKRSVTPLGESLPDVNILNKGWSRDMRLLPSFSDAELYNYLVLNDTRTFDSKPINARRQLKAKVFYTDRHLHSLEYNDIDNEMSHCYVRAKCIRSIPGMSSKENGFEYRVWACLSKISGRVHAAGCQCEAGEGEACNHIAALMYALVDITDKKEDGLDVCTSVECLWNQPPRSRKLSPKKVTELNFKKQKFKLKDTKPPVETTKKENMSKRKVTPINVERFSDKLQKVSPHAAFLLSQEKLLGKFKKPEKAVVEDSLGLPMPPFMFRQNVDLNGKIPKIAFENYLKNLILDEEQCVHIEKSTRKQNLNKNWIVARSDRVTSSNFGAIVNRKKDTPPISLLKTVLGYTTFESASTKWGKTHEPAARRVYQKHSRAQHKELTVTECGLITVLDFPYLGCSPDGLIYCGHCEEPKGTLEIKCPYKYRMLSPYEAAKQKDFFCELVEDNVQLKRKHSYYYQIQGHMGITGRKWCDFFVWTLEGFNIERIKFDKGVWDKMVPKLQSFFTEHVVPEIFTRRIKLTVK